MPPPTDPTRRDSLKILALLAGAATMPTATATTAAPGAPHFRHSLVWWCYHSFGQKWSTTEMIAAAKKLGCASIELAEPEHWPALAGAGLTCAIAGNGYPKTGFVYGLNNPRHAAEVVSATARRIEECAAAKVPSVISFVGNELTDPDDPASAKIPRDASARETAKNLKELARAAEKHGVTVCVEHLNSRDGSHPMAGHPGYLGDDLDELLGILRSVGSPRVKLLFDIYHVQIMHGDLCRRIASCAELIGHVHTAGVPGRHELDAAQEINYPAVMSQLKRSGYAGYVGHEFIPTRDALAGLAEAVAACEPR